MHFFAFTRIFQLPLIIVKISVSGTASVTLRVVHARTVSKTLLAEDQRHWGEAFSSHLPATYKESQSSFQSFGPASGTDKKSDLERRFAL